MLTYPLPYDLLYQDERKWLFCTLDGEIGLSAAGSERYFDQDAQTWRHRYPRNARRGILEIKTASPVGAKWKDWSEGHMPQNYMVQCCHQLLATGWDFVILFACLFSMDGSYTIKEYEIERSDVEEDLAWLLQEETRFWGYVERGELPPQRLML